MSDLTARSELSAGGRPSELPRWAWLWFPPLILLFELAFRLYDDVLYRRYWHSEGGPVETGTVLVLLPGIVAGLLLVLRYRRRLPSPWLAVWMALTTLGCVYMAGEELSWGQQWFGWATPHSLQALNDQGETNLHNVSSWFDQKPRILLEIWVLVGGLLYHLWRKFVGRTVPVEHWASWFWPSPLVIPSALLAILVKLPDRLNDWFALPVPPPFDMRESETQEYYFALFLTLYLCSVYARLRRQVQAEVPSG